MTYFPVCKGEIGSKMRWVVEKVEFRIVCEELIINIEGFFN